MVPSFGPMIQTVTSLVAPLVSDDVQRKMIVITQHSSQYNGLPSVLLPYIAGESNRPRCSKPFVSAASQMWY